ncbi:MAG: FtsX-like permease family protein [Desulfobacterota bacterium]|nr:FtsX-like permease family protein [Thermodesulfobacteriota bacterium]
MRIVAKSFLRYLPRRRSLSLLQLMGVACGVAAVVGMTLSAQTALRSFHKAIEFLRGQATHSIQRPVGPMEEHLLIQLSRDPAVEWFSPVIDRQLSLLQGGQVRLLGIDPFLDRTLRPELARVEWLDQKADVLSHLLSFLTDERSVLVDQDLIEEIEIPPDTLLETTKGRLRVKGVFSNPSAEPLMVMDIGHAQKLYQLQGWVDRVDLILSDEPGFRSRWGKGFLIQSSRQRSETYSGMLRAFRLNLEALSLLALFVGVFLIYNTAMFTVISRRRDAGILRSLGATRVEIFLAFLSEILILGAIGGALGGWVGYLLTRFLTGMIGDTISNLYFFLRPEPVVWSLWIPVVGILLGCGAGLVGGIVPLVELIRTDPVQALSGRAPGRKSGQRAIQLALAGLAVFLVSLMLFLIPDGDVYVGFAGVFGFVLGASLLTGVLLLGLHPFLKKLLVLWGGLPGKVAAGTIRQNLGRTGVAIAAFMISLSMSIGLGTMIGSFRQSLIWWMGTQIRGDLYIGKILEAEVPEDFFEELKGLEGLGGVHPYRNVQTLYQETPIHISAVDAKVLQKYARFGWVKGGDENWEPVKQGGVIVSESFARRFGVKSGDTITLDGRQGPTAFRVGAIFYDYTTEHGLVMMDRSTYLKVFGDRTLNNIGIFIDPDNPRRSELIQEVKKRAEARGLPVLTGAQLHREILEVFDTTFAITRSMRVIAIVVAFFGIAGALLTLFIERSREFGIYRALGFSTGQVAKMTLMEGLGMGMISFILSLVVGTGLAVLLIKVINLRSFNWTIFYHPTPEPYLWTGLIAILASIGAAVYPIWRVYRTYPQIQIREE